MRSPEKFGFVAQEVTEAEVAGDAAAPNLPAGREK
jgi:hypothetical protein